MTDTHVADTAAVATDENGRQLPWHGFAEPLDNVTSVQAALERGGLDWDVELRPVYFGAKTEKGNPTRKAIEDRYATVRTDTEEPLGVVGANYRVCQNRDALAFADNLTDGGATFDAVGTYRGGKRIFVSMKLDDGIEVLGDDAHDLYLFLTTSHDGSRAVSVSVVPVRVACLNMEAMALRSAKTKWSARHTVTLEGRLAEARQTLALAHRARDAYAAEVEALANLEVSDDRARELLVQALPENLRTDRRVQGLERVYASSPNLEDVRGTGYGVLQAFGEWVDHGRETKNAEATFALSFDGSAAAWRTNLHRRLSELAATR